MKRVLIAGSEIVLREMIVTILADIPVEIRTADSIDSVLSECRHGCFDLVIMLDIAPILNGTNPIELLRPKPLRRPEIFVIAWQHSEQAVLSLLECGVSQYITLPINIRRVRHKIHETLGYDN